MPYTQIQGVPVFGDPLDNAVEQIVNCAREAEHAALMADHHLGYAVPIGGVVAYEGRVSPSGVGYDIACLAEGSLVTMADGCCLPIEHVLGAGSLLGCWRDQITNVGPALSLQRKRVHSTLWLALQSGDVLQLTPDHRVLTRTGWREAGSLRPGEGVAVSSYIGVESRPHPLDYRLLRLLGYAVGDGHVARRGHRISFYTARDEDAGRLLADLHALGFDQANVHRRIRPNGSVENNVYCNDAAMHALFANWGLRPGRAAWRDGDFSWMTDLPPHLRAAFLGGLFSAEMNSPVVRDTRLIGAMTIKQGGLSPLPLLRIVGRLLRSLNFASSTTPSGHPDGAGRQVYALSVLGGAREWSRLFREVGFPYAAYKQQAAARAMSLTWQREAIVEAREQANARCRVLRAEGTGVYDVAERVQRATGLAYTHSMALKALYEDRGRSRVPASTVLASDVAGDFVWSPVVTVKEIREPVWVYDLPLSHEAHNFVAEGIVVHNCGNKAVLLDADAADVRANIGRIMDDVWSALSFGVGRKNEDAVDHELFYDDPAWDLRVAADLKDLARSQLGTIGSGNHYVDLFTDEQDRVWVGVHFGSRGLGHKLATHFVKAGGGKDGIHVDPVLLEEDTELGQEYIACMKLAGRYAYAGRDWVCERVAGLLGADILDEMHNHHNFAWQEEHDGQHLWVVRKGATPAFPGQRGFVGGSMGDISVILEGVDSAESEAALYSTVHGAGRVMSRTQAAGKSRWKKGRKVKVSEGAVSRAMMMDWVRRAGVELRGAGTDESPHCYKRLPHVLDYHAPTVRILHTLTPIGVAMAGENEFDPFKD